MSLQDPKSIWTKENLGKVCQIPYLVRSKVQICICWKTDNRIRQRNHGFQPKYRFGFPIIKNGIRQKNDGLEPKYRFGFSYISIKEMSRKIMGLAEVQIWISMNVYKGIGKKND